MILLHVLIALFSVIFTGITSLIPSKTKLTVSYVSVLSTIATGTYLIVTRPAHMIATCLEGLFYIGIVTIGIILAQRRLAKETSL